MSSSQYVLSSIKRPPIDKITDNIVDVGERAGLPIDRTRCPYCFGHRDMVKGCSICDGIGSVCPVCTGSRFVMIERGGATSFGYQECPACCDAVMGPSGWPEKDHRGMPKYTRNPNREMLRIQDWRERHGDVEQYGKESDLF